MANLKTVETNLGVEAIERATLSIREVARILGVGKNAAYTAVRTGELPVVRIGGRLLVPRAALERLLTGESVTRAGRPGFPEIMA